jgi:hypothetical protein
VRGHGFAGAGDIDQSLTALGVDAAAAVSS